VQATSHAQLFLREPKYLPPRADICPQSPEERIAHGGMLPMCLISGFPRQRFARDPVIIAVKPVWVAVRATRGLKECLGLRLRLKVPAVPVRA
jgi:hypothetical protein